MKTDLRSLSHEKLVQYITSLGEKPFRARQIETWLWQKSCTDFEQMSDLPKALRERIAADFQIHPVKVDQIQRSADGTIKNAVRLRDGMVVESVLIPTEKRITACISSQVGCSLDCRFCATARLKRMRNLDAQEIYDQVVAIREQAEYYYGRKLTNIVYMGMGEPLLNYANVMRSIEKITSPSGLGMSAKRITLSTVGIAKMIKTLADDNPGVKLAVSLHSAIDEVRSRIMPINQSNDLATLTEALEYWYARTRSRITFEYVVWKGINDRDEDIRALVKLCKRIPSKVNLIEYNSIGDPNFEQADPERIEAYKRALENIGVVAKIRRSRGKDIDAACGQLANKNDVAPEMPKKELPKTL
ncbi:putative dual-specificity RNA methyltransferase RlmN [Thermaurantimonas aggregans]|uniref:Probable dual-specificity RNA methyltransferase RlmN n=1 Tax=Thermaurantimonas aggregans TaxID=2173829 RepID=A0A401XLE9_9FLAO|nr:23S rRNA (adenine(2503)-C(2))-methyltransferase RlmN [Thermaurantimonas aggregans]MCX8148327.1 23S rRNA (adenine(2503)-C(2))-methyltransferase RlmN [Thermaurantimonas aggregans]GCD77832.1 putative dual-specificity RNA methyltransferase RlmN [Thermaurantimonas aggregans]